MSVISKFRNPADKIYPIIKKVTLPLSVIFIICAIVFTYVAGIEIDEGTPAMYALLDSLSVIFLVLGSLGVLALVGIIVMDALRKKEYYKHYNKSKLGKHVYTFDVVNFIIMTLFCVCCIYPFA